MTQKEQANNHNTASSKREVFILRLWRSRSGGPGWRGEVQHVRSEETVPIGGLGDLVPVIEKYVETVPGKDKERGLK